MNRFRAFFVTSFVAVGVYLGTAWFFFGSTHPCGILEARQRPDVLREQRTSFFKEMKFWVDLSTETQFSSAAVDGLTKHLESAEQWEREALQALHWRTWNKTPAECAWEAIRPAAARPQRVENIY
jgi:hypothetical protein